MKIKTRFNKADGAAHIATSLMSEKCKMESGKLLSEDRKNRGQEVRLLSLCDAFKNSPKLQTLNSLPSCPPDLLTSSRKAAFTLAEVLITLAVIGVVAAMTLPVLIQKQQKITWVNKLKANYSLLNQGFKTMMAEEGVERIDDTSVWRSMSADCYKDFNPTTSDRCKYFLPNLKKYFKITSIEPLTDYTWKYLNDSTAQTQYTGANNYAIHLSNGAMICAYVFLNPQP